MKVNILKVENDKVCPNCNGEGMVKTRTVKNPFNNCSICKGEKYIGK